MRLEGCKIKSKSDVSYEFVDASACNDVRACISERWRLTDELTMAGDGRGVFLLGAGENDIMLERLPGCDVDEALHIPGRTLLVQALPQALCYISATSWMDFTG